MKPTWKPKLGKSLILRTCAKDGTSQHSRANGFKWPLDVGAEVVAPDWSPTPECGHGLHGLLWGCGDSFTLSWDLDAMWIAAEVDASSVVQIQDCDSVKVKVPSATVVAFGSRQEVATLVAEHAPPGSVVHGATVSGDNTATAGDGGTATAGECGTATAGECGVVAIRWWNGKRYRWAIRECGTEPGMLKPNVKYRLNDSGEFVEVA